MYIILDGFLAQEEAVAASIALPAPREVWRPAHNSWLVALTVTLATFMEVLDTSIANVALPHIAGSLGASSDESTWVLTSYLVSNAIVLPISAWLATRIGRKRFYMSCVALFATSSFFCGLAPTLGTLIVFRVLQGAGGGGLQPSEQAILADTFPASKRGMAFAMYGMGGRRGSRDWADAGRLDYRQLQLALDFLHQRPNQRAFTLPDASARRRPSVPARRKGLHVDYIGLGLIAVGIGFLQIVLDKGQEADWFAAHWITALSILAVGLLVAWVIWEWRHPNPIVELKLLKNRNFAAAGFFMFILGMVLYGTTVLIPQFLQLLLGYSATSAGEALAGGGFIMMLTMPIAGMLVSKGDARIMMSCGLATTALSLYYMATHISLGMDFKTAAMLRVYQTFGLAFIFIPSNTLSYVGVPPTKSNQISSMINFIRNIGGSIGIALLATFITRTSQQRQSYLAGHMNQGNPMFRNMLDGMTATLHSQGLSVSEASRQAYARIAQLLQEQATALAYKDVISFLTILVACLTPLAFIMKRPSAHDAAAPPVH